MKLQLSTYPATLGLGGAALLMQCASERLDFGRQQRVCLRLSRDGLWEFYIISGCWRVRLLELTKVTPAHSKLDGRRLPSERWNRTAPRMAERASDESEAHY